MSGTSDGVEVLERFDICRLGLGDGRVADLIIFSRKNGNWDSVDRVDWVECAFNVVGAGPVVNIFLETLGLSGLHRVILNLQTVGFVSG